MKKSIQLLLLAMFLSCSMNGHSETAYHLSARKFSRVITGLENFLSGEAGRFKGKKIALVANHSSVDSNLRHSVFLLRDRGIRISFVMVPEHGLFGDQADYDRKAGYQDESIGLRVYNLHKLDAEAMRKLTGPVDAVVFDIQDLGMRCYTYVSSLKFIMDSLRDTGKELIVLDRPNPVGFLGVDGPYLEDRFYAKFIAAFPATFLYDLTPGEAARYYAGEYCRGVKLTVVPMKNYERDMLYHETGLPWLPPSPNLPTPMSAVCYAAIELLEGSNISLGRGTVKPFEYIGAPWIEPVTFCSRLQKLGLKNFRFRPVYFTPAFSKYKDRKCGGAQIFYVGGVFSPTEVAYRILAMTKKYYREFHWIDIKGKYDTDFLAGTDRFRKFLLEGKEYTAFENTIKEKRDRFEKKRRKYLLY